MMEATTSERLLDEAQRLVQLCGFNGFSYADLSRAIGIAKPSIHYHFPSKQDLGLQLVKRYRRNLQHGLAFVETNFPEPKIRLLRYVEFFGQLIQDGRLCLCSALAADAGSLSVEIQLELEAAFTDKISWLEQNLKSIGIPNPNIEAKQLVATVDGAMVMARAYQNTAMYNDICQKLLESYHP